jgi:hypothetical protein
MASIAGERESLASVNISSCESGAQDMRVKEDRDTFIHNINRYLLSVHYASGSHCFVRGAVMKKIGKNPCLHRANNKQEEENNKLDHYLNYIRW